VLVAFDNLQKTNMMMMMMRFAVCCACSQLTRLTGWHVEDVDTSLASACRHSDSDRAVDRDRTLTDEQTDDLRRRDPMFNV